HPCRIVFSQVLSAPEFADVVFLVDSSDNLGSKAFPFVKMFINKMINALPIEASKYRIAVAQYSDDLHSEFLLNTFKSKNPMLNYLKKNFAFRGGSPRLGQALQRAHKTYFSGLTGGRDAKQFPPVLVVLASGPSEDEVEAPAKALQRDGVKIISLGMSAASDRVLKAMATPQYDFHLPKIRDVGMFSSNMTQIIKNIVKDQAGKDDTPLEACKTSSLADIAFLVEESVPGNGRNFENLQTFLKETLSSLDVKENCTRIALVTYGTRTHVISSLRNDTTQEELLQEIENLSPKAGKAFIGAAINVTRKEIFSRGAGSRKSQGVQQIAVLITHRSSEDSVSEAALSLRREGVTVFAIGIKGANETQLDWIVSYPPERYVSTLKTYSDLAIHHGLFLKKLQNEIRYKGSVLSEQTVRLQSGCVETEEADIYFLIDGSGSIRRRDFQDIKTFLNGVIKMFSIAPHKVRIGAVQYSTLIRVEFYIDQYSNQVNLQKAIEGITQYKNRTYTGEALKYMLKLFQDPQWQRGPHVPRHLIILTDGKSDDSVDEPARMLRDAGVNIFAVGVKDAKTAQLQAIAGSEERVYCVQNFDALGALKDVVVRDLCFEEACKMMEADIVFLVDSSGSIGADNFEKMKTFMKNVVNRTKIGADQVQVGLVQFSDINKEEFQLNQYNTKSGVSDAIDRLSQIGRGTLTGSALTFVSDYFHVSKGARPNVKKFLVLLTDGKSQDAVKEAAIALRQGGVTVYSVGVFGSEYSELEEISGSSDMVFYVENFDFLDRVVDVLFFDVCSLYDDCKRIQVLDVVFVIDNSGSLSETQYESIINFTIHLVNRSDVGSDGVQFGALKYSDDPQILFYLNKHTTRSGIIKDLREAKQVRGRTYTAKALRHSNMFFMEENGSRLRRGVKQILIVITDGESHDRYELSASAKALRDKGIIIYAVGVAGAKETELLDIAGSQDKYFYVDSFEKLKDIYKSITNFACGNSQEECNIQEADLVFLCDGSTSISQADFDYMKEFLIEVTNNLDIQPFKVQVGMAQFSHDYQEEFKLNRFSNRLLLTDRINKTIKTEGGTSIGKALRKVRSYFKPDGGSRINAGISQILLLITDGQSQDPVASAAEELRRLGVEILTVGVGDVNLDQLLQITGSPDNILTVGKFQEVKKVKKRVIRNICRPPEKIRCCVDVVVGFDISSYQNGQLLFQDQPLLESYLLELLRPVSHLKGVSCEAGSLTQVRIAFQVQNADRPFTPKFQVYSENILKDLKRVRVTGPTHLSGHFLHSLWDTFQNQSSAQSKVVLVFSDGLKSDEENVLTLEEKSDELRKAGLNALFIISLSRALRSEDIQGIEFGKGFEYRTHLTIGMNGLGSMLSTLVANVAERTCCCEFCKCSGDQGVKGSPGPAASKVLQDLIFCFPYMGGSSVFCFLQPLQAIGVAPIGCRSFFEEKYTHFHTVFYYSQGSPGSRGSPGDHGPKGVRGDPVSCHNTIIAAVFYTQLIKALLLWTLKKITFFSCHTSSPDFLPGKPDCPAYPTELVFAIDMSRVVTERRFSETKDMIVSIVNDTKIRTRNCPVGARVSVVSYGTKTRNHIRLSDHYQKKKLIEEINKIAYERTTRDQNLGQAMRFVAKNLFKRTLRGANVRRIAVFFSHGLPADPLTLATATMEFSALNIIPVVLAFSDERAVQDAFELDDSGTFQLISVLTTGSSGAAEKLQLCTLCYDPCFPTGCVINPRPPVTSYVDAAFLLDAPESMGFSAFEEMRAFLTTVLDNFDITSEPGISVQGDRVAVLSHAPPGYLPNTEECPVKVEFDLVTYNNLRQMKSHLQESFQQLDGDAFIGHALRWTVDNIFLGTPNPRKNRVIFVVTTGKTSSLDKEVLKKESLRAKCQGYAIFVFSMGPAHGDEELEDLASHPLDHHLVRLGRIHKPDFDYIVRFIKPFIVSVRRAVNQYPSTDIMEKCINISSQITAPPEVEDFLQEHTIL
uniref:VWFA domain-containing protein n=1 Tax=Ornithorhynchus anatinus TaxID=9258 RepID=F7C483_ORNAN